MAGQSRDRQDISELEKSQAELRQSIEESKRLTEKSQQLLDQHRKQRRPDA